MKPFLERCKCLYKCLSHCRGDSGCLEYFLFPVAPPLIICQINARDLKFCIKANEITLRHFYLIKQNRFYTPLGAKRLKVHLIWFIFLILNFKARLLKFSAQANMIILRHFPQICKTNFWPRLLLVCFKFHSIGTLFLKEMANERNISNISLLKFIS